MITLPFVDEKSNWDQRQVSPHPPSKPAGRDAKNAKGKKVETLNLNTQNISEYRTAKEAAQ